MRDCERLLSFLGYSDLTETQPEHTKTVVERELSSALTPLQASFLKDGVLIIENFLTKPLMDAYCQIRERLPKDRQHEDNYYGGWAYPTPFMVYDELRDLALSTQLAQLLKELIGETMGLNLSLTGWQSTQRDFHADQYLNPRGLWSKYLAVWFALDDIDKDAGPFEFVRGSHTWPVLTRDKLFQYLSPEEQASPDWPTFTQDAVARMCKEEIERRGGLIEQFVPKKGTILIWHSNLIHRGSVPKDGNLLRKSLICHYSSVQTRRLIDMPKVLQHKGQGFYFDLPTNGRVRPKL